MVPLSPGFARSRSHIPQPESRHTIPLSPGFARSRSHIPSRLRRGWANKQKAPSSKLVVLFDLSAVRGGFENENQCATESIE